ncbi:MAG TPA: M1 family aminopeptidase, partial [Flavobacteriaceae bacterium]|nr:M1 family aminopeptidase [Flavobacteriaceae bacterium]
KEQSDKGNGEALLNPKASSLTFYQKGAWALHILREKIGENAFREAVKNYLETNAYHNVTTSDFLFQAEKSSGMDLSDFKENWLQQSAFQADEALESLRKSLFIVSYLNLAAARKIPFQDKKMLLSKALDFPVNDYLGQARLNETLGQEVVRQLSEETFSQDVIQLYEKAFKSDNILVRQAIATFVETVPQELKSEYESLLKDASYFTKEKALLHLWSNFPKNRVKYLDATQGIEGFPDKNIELLWLTLNLVTPEYHPEKKQDVFEKLSHYTAPEFAYPVRENAFGYLYQINTFTAQNYIDLLEGCVHPVWRFQKFCRELLEELLKDSDHYKNLKNIRSELPEKQKQFLDKKLE